MIPDSSVDDAFQLFKIIPLLQATGAQHDRVGKTRCFKVGDKFVQLDVDSLVPTIDYEQPVVFAMAAFDQLPTDVVPVAFRAYHIDQPVDVRQPGQYELPIVGLHAVDVGHIQPRHVPPVFDVMVFNACIRNRTVLGKCIECLALVHIHRRLFRGWAGNTGFGNLLSGEPVEQTALAHTGAAKQTDQQRPAISLPEKISRGFGFDPVQARDVRFFQPSQGVGVARPRPYPSKAIGKHVVHAHNPDFDCSASTSSPSLTPNNAVLIWLFCLYNRGARTSFRSRSRTRPRCCSRN